MQWEDQADEEILLQYLWAMNCKNTKKNNEIYESGKNKCEANDLQTTL